MNGKEQSFVGMIEGFYGVFYTPPERDDFIRFAGQHGFDWYLYAPKDDRQHRARWWEAYPDAVMSRFSQTVQVACEAGVTFCYAISPGESVCYSRYEDYQKLTHKLRSFFEIGVRAFGLLYDDNTPGFHHAEDRERYISLAHAQADLANRVHAFLIELDPACSLCVCPVDYWGSAPFGRPLQVLGQELSPEIDLFYTGPEIVSPEISANDARQFTDTTYRRPLIWDNYPVNDLDMQGDLHMNAFTGRSPDLPRLTRGLLANVMIQAEASKIPLLTLAEYWRAPEQYDPAAAYERALRAVVGDESAPALRLFADMASCSVAQPARSASLAQPALNAAAAIERGESSGSSPDVLALERLLTEIDEAAYHLKFRMANLALRNNLLPWIEVLEHWMWMARYALDALRAIEQNQPYLEALKRVHEYRELIDTHPRRVGAQPLSGVVEAILKRIELDQRRRVAMEWAPSIL